MQQVYWFLQNFSREKNSPAETVDLSQPAQESKQSFEKMLEVDEGQLVNAKDAVVRSLGLWIGGVAYWNDWNT